MYTTELERRQRERFVRIKVTICTHLWHQLIDQAIYFMTMSRLSSSIAHDKYQRTHTLPKTHLSHRTFLSRRVAFDNSGATGDSSPSSPDILSAAKFPDGSANGKPLSSLLFCDGRGWGTIAAPGSPRCARAAMAPSSAAIFGYDLAKTRGTSSSLCESADLSLSTNGFSLSVLLFRKGGGGD